MKKPFISCCALAFFLVSAPLSGEPAGNLSGQITRVEDGDTLILSNANQVPFTLRLLGIDAPELAQEFGGAAQASLTRLAFGRPAQAACKEPLTSHPRLCVVSIDGNDVGLTQIRSGMAWRFLAHANRQTATERAEYAQAEFTAKIQRAGLWKGKNPTPPWLWRRSRPDE